MADKTKIEWTDATWNPITGCSMISEGCRFCYAARLAATRMKNHWSRCGLASMVNGRGVFNGEVRFNREWLEQPLQWRQPKRIFVCAHSDLFHEKVPDEWIDHVFWVMDLAKHHEFQVLTKRSCRMMEYLSAPETLARLNEGGRPPDQIKLPLPNVTIMVSAEDQAAAETRIPHLLSTPAAKRGVSLEPLLGSINLRLIQYSDTRNRCPEIPEGWPTTVDALSMEDRTGLQRDMGALDWVIVGGESGPGARPMHPDWARDIRDQCAEAGVPFHFKQWGDWSGPLYQQRELPDRRHRRLNGTDGLYQLRIGKKRAGRLLDGREHNGMPG